MTKINYVIATWNGKNQREHNYPLPNDVLKIHLNKILSLKTTIITQITIMVAESPNYYKGYYDIDDIVEKSPIPIIIHHCVNYGFSPGQFLTAYKTFQDFDYYLFNEDDYCANMDNYDTLFIELYNKKIIDNKGVLCSTINGSKEYVTKGDLPVHWEGSMFVSKYTLDCLHTDLPFDLTPYQLLDRFTTEHDNTINLRGLKLGYAGGYYQVVFSHMFTLSGIEHYDYFMDIHNGIELSFFYWDDKTNSVYKYTDTNVMIKQFDESTIVNSPIVPIQLVKPINLSIYKKPKIIFIIGMHRCGTSLLSNCLHENGWNIGKTKCLDKDWQNPNGYFENDRLLHIHEQILEYNNSTWLDIKTKDMVFTDEHVLDYKNALKLEFDQSNKILIKDPRLTFFKTFLHKVCEQDFDKKFIFLTRNKDQCTRSLCKAQNKSIDNCSQLYDITHECIESTDLLLNHNDIVYNNDIVMNIISSHINEPINISTLEIVDYQLHREK